MSLPKDLAPFILKPRKKSGLVGPIKTKLRELVHDSQRAGMYSDQKYCKQIHAVNRLVLFADFLLDAHGSPDEEWRLRAVEGLLAAEHAHRRASGTEQAGSISAIPPAPPLPANVVSLDAARARLRRAACTCECESVE